MTTNSASVRGASSFATAALTLLSLLFWQAAEARAQWTTSGTNTTTTNSVGIGIATPAQMFHIHSVGTWAGTRVTTAATGTTINDGVHFGYDDGYGAYVWNREATATIFATSNTERMRINPAGNVGVGTASPASLLNLVGQDAALTFGTAGATDSSSFSITVADSGYYTNNSNGRNLLIKAGNSDNTAGKVGGNLILNPGAPVAPATVFGNVLLASGGGNVGIGTGAPGQKLDVAGNVNASGLCIAGDCRTAWSQVGGGTGGSSQWTTSGSSIYYSAGRVGVGTSAAPRGGYSDLLLGSGGDNPQLELFGATKSTALTHDEALGGVVVYTNGPAFSPSFFIGNAGKVGVGTTAPTTALHVVGDITATGNIAAKYQDLAEWVPSTQKLAAGTVVVLDVEKSNHVMASNSSYDTAVAGVISAQPGIALGERGEGKVLVATTGRVKVRVDATNAPIKVGDLLVTGDKPGVAMKSEPVSLGGRKMHAPGTIIGKALEPLAGGVGEILVLLSLQ